jgi:hypothetical protein
MKSKSAKFVWAVTPLIVLVALGWLALRSPRAPCASLPELVKSITQTIEHADYEEFCKLVDGDAPRREIFDWLIGQHQRLDYNELFAMQWSGSAKDKFTLGGHDYGHLHLDFVEGASGWRLVRVWNCK